MKRTLVLFLSALLLTVFLSACGGESQTQTESEAQEAAAENYEQTSSEVPADMASSEVYLIDCYNYTNKDGEACTYFAGAVLAPDFTELSFGLGNPQDESVGDIYYLNTIGTWYIVRGSFLGTYSISDLTLGGSNHDPSHSDEVLRFNDWGEPLSDEELEKCGVYKFGDAYAAIGRGKRTYGSDEFGLNISLIPILKNGQETYIDEGFVNDVLSIYTGDGTLLTDYFSEYEATLTLSKYYNLSLMFAADGKESDEIKSLCDSLGDLGIYYTHTRSDGTIDRYDL